MSDDKNKEKLLKEKEHLVKELDHYKMEDPYLVPDRSNFNTVDDDITEIEGHDRITATRINVKERLGEVKVALLRIEEGSYGSCKNCGKKIPDDRLEALPSAVLCIDCHSKD